MFELTINYDTCQACGSCIDHCPTMVYDQDENGRPVITNPDDCLHCHTCSDTCPTNSITINYRSATTT